MLVLSSRFEVGVPQRDGRCYVHEWHELDTGEVFEREYGPIDVDAINPDTGGRFDLQLVAENFARQKEVDAAAAAEGVE
jgi:hypothetical protein